MKGHPIGSLCVIVRGSNKGAVVEILSEPRLCNLMCTYTGNSRTTVTQRIKPITFWTKGPLSRPGTSVSRPASDMRPLEDPDSVEERLKRIREKIREAV